MSNFLVFAGTSEGRRLIETLADCGASVCASVATEYGKILLPEHVKVFAERLDADDMATLLKSLHFSCVIDATHPYASVVTKNIKAACAVTDTRYLRLSRPEGQSEGCVFVEDAAQAAEVLAATTGKVLLTTGSKELDVFTRVPDYQNRIFPRVLPTIESVQRCLALGYHVQNIVAMQGPFSREMNGATMRQLGASILVTKESGDAGGFAEKIGAAKDTGATAVVIGRPHEDAGMTYEEVLETLRADFMLSKEPPKQKTEAMFPMFTDLTNRKIAVFGGGTIATRRTAVLAPFCGKLTVISPQIDHELETLGVTLIRRPYLQGDCAGYDIVLAATDNREVNHAIYEEAKASAILVNVADAAEECSFYFPAVIQQGAVVVGVTASGTDHKLAKKVADNIRMQIEQIVPQKEVKDAKP
ncbi:precorrin-6A reductase [Oscillospiraceae bacterium PP1C4]